MVRLRKLARVASVAIRACANALITTGLALARLAEHIEKCSASK